MNILTLTGETIKPKMEYIWPSSAQDAMHNKSLKNLAIHHDLATAVDNPKLL